ncbi:uncharacterized protein [Gossypium hirsutum]|uniref:Uncharacterized protein n=1 Tax=Gossypium hirsutum TaxID=3635 RepID=A0A1U8LVT2_GOSHI|nr:uncharacterized protein LOC107931328 [Gossypium hirsutum]
MEEYIRNLLKAFMVLRAYNMKLNIEKCAFSVRVGRFLGFMVSERGIKVNSEKIHAILEMPLPRTALRTSFSWTKECQIAFEELKLYLTSPPLLKSPRVKETLYLYLATSNETIAVVLVRAEDVHRFPVYYISKLANYVATSGRVTKWSIELAKFGVEFAPRTKIKGQISFSLVVHNLVVSPPQEGIHKTDNLKSWLVYVDGSTAKAGSGARLACQLRVNDLVIHIDSQLVAKQMNGEYEIKDAVLKKYHSVATQLLIGFDKVQTKQLPRSDNTCTDALSKLTSSVVIEQRGKVLFEYSDTPSYNVPQVLCIDQEETWMTPIVRTLPGTYDKLDKKKIAKLQHKDVRYTLLEGVLYIKGFSHPLLQCLSPFEAEYMM